MKRACAGKYTRTRRVLFYIRVHTHTYTHVHATTSNSANISKLTSWYRSMHRPKHFWSLLLKLVPGAVMQTLKHLSRTVCSVQEWKRRREECFVWFTSMRQKRTAHRPHIKASVPPGRTLALTGSGACSGPAKSTRMAQHRWLNPQVNCSCAPPVWWFPLVRRFTTHLTHQGTLINFLPSSSRFWSSEIHFCGLFQCK